MSANDFFNVWNRSRQQGSSLTILLAIASYADEYGVAWPQLSTIAKYARVDRRTITRQLPGMVGEELIWLEKSASAYSKARQHAQSHLYIVLLGRSPAYIKEMQRLCHELTPHTPIYGGVVDNKIGKDNLASLLELVEVHGKDISDRGQDSFDRGQDSFDRGQDSLPPDSFKDSFKDSFYDKEREYFFNQLFDFEPTRVAAERQLSNPVVNNGEAQFHCNPGSNKPIFYQNVFNNRNGIRVFNLVYGTEIRSISVIGVEE